MKVLLALLLAPALLACKADPHVPQARQELNDFAKTIREYRDKNGRWPPNLVEAVGQSCPAGHDGCLSDKGKRLDPWGKAYEYDQSLNSALVRSAGPDQVLGSRDDLEVFIPAQAPTKR